MRVLGMDFLDRAAMPKQPYRAIGGIHVRAGSERVRILENHLVGGAGVASRSAAISIRRRYATAASGHAAPGGGQRSREHASPAALDDRASYALSRS